MISSVSQTAGLYMFMPDSVYGASPTLVTSAANVQASLNAAASASVAKPAPLAVSPTIEISSPPSSSTLENLKVLPV